MSNSITNDDVMQVARMALDGLSQRQQVISRNLANVDTPGYRAQTFKFEDALKRAVRGESRMNLAASHSTHMASTTSKAGFRVENRPGGSLRADQNNVDIDVELVEMSTTGIQYQAVTQSVNKKLQLLKFIANSR